MRVVYVLLYLLSVVSARCVVEYEDWIGDGWCDDDDEYNNADCDWDGGDCCESTCVSTEKYDCTKSIMNCLDPDSTINNTAAVDDVDDDVSNRTTATECPDMAPGMFCDRSYFPVVCGANNCTYANPCLAEAAGFDLPSECRDSALQCPSSDNNLTACQTIYSPVTCGGDCIYDNSCLAEAAGFIVESQCAADSTTSSSSPPLSTTCPTTSTNGCPGIYDPILCGSERCPYRNKCDASSVGFEPLFDCVQPEDDNDSNYTQFRTCPQNIYPREPCLNTTEQHTICNGGCYYENSCLAIRAGFNVTEDCESLVSCPESASDAICYLIYLPVYCGECKYANDCLASAAGYDVTEECSFDPPPNE